MIILQTIMGLLFVLYFIGAWYFAGIYDKQYANEPQPYPQLYAFFYFIGVLIWPVFYVIATVKKVRMYMTKGH